jgi:glycosyltransferase involved in cell wall biosynthesis
VTVHSLRSGLGVLSPLVAQQTGSSWPKSNRIFEILQSKRFDVIHYHNTSLFGPKVLQLRPDYADFIKLYTTHEHWLVCPMHVLWKNNERVCDKPDCLRCTLAFKRPPQWWRYTSLLEHCTEAIDTFLSPSAFTRRMHQERGFQKPIEVLPYFVPEHDLTPSDATPPHPKPYFLFVGRLEKIKGIETLFPIFRRYDHADLLIAGNGTYEEELRAQAKGMSNVHFLGALSQQQLCNLYRHAVALLVPSSCYEVFGIIIIESFLQRTPVIAHDLGGLSEVVQESGGGLLYRTGQELRASMERLRTDPALRQRMGQAGYETYKRKWSETAHLNRYFELLEQTALRKFGSIPWQDAARQSLRLLQPMNS